MICYHAKFGNKASNTSLPHSKFISQTYSGASSTPPPRTKKKLTAHFHQDGKQIRFAKCLWCAACPILSTPFAIILHIHHALVK